MSYFYFRSVWPNDLEHVACRTCIIFTKFQLGQPVRSVPDLRSTADTLRHAVTSTYLLIFFYLEHL